jgi:actin-related protein
MTDLKKLCYISADFESEAEDLTPELSAKFKLPDGKEISLRNERFTAPEIMLQPGLAGLRLNGVQQYMHQSVNLCKEDSRKDLYSNVVLSGGNTLFKGIAERLSSELH